MTEGDELREELRNVRIREESYKILADALAGKLRTSEMRVQQLEQELSRREVEINNRPKKKIRLLLEFEVSSDGTEFDEVSRIEDS